MELRPPSSTAASAAASSSKLRLMCSYGGHIVPRPGGPSKSFCYVGGDTRIVSVVRHTITTLDLLISHLSATLSVGFSFTLKYQLPNLDLNSLISLTSDEDFQIFIDEYDRLCSSPPSSAPCRIRLFLFPSHTVPGCSAGPVIRHPKTESWFFDALKSAKILQKGLGETHGFGFCHGSGGEGHGFVTSGPETAVLETSSSFGSTSSSASLTNLPWKSQSNEDNEFVLQDSKVKLKQTNSVPSDNSVSNIVPHHHHQNISYQDPIIVQASSSSMEARGTETIITSETTNSTNIVQRQPVQFVPSQHMTTYHQPNHLHHPHPVYLVPPNYAQIVSTNNNILPITTASNHSSFLSPQNYYYYRPAGSSATTSSYGNYKQQGEVDVSAMYVQPQNVSVPNNTESPDEHGGFGGGDHDLIYKSQPPLPPFRDSNSQY